MNVFISCKGLHVQVLKSAVRRIDLGGKALTNYLIELVSYRCAAIFQNLFAEILKPSVLACSS